jgi:MFS family permease
MDSGEEDRLMGNSGYSRRIFWGVSSFQALAMFRRGLFYSYLSIYLRYYLGLNVTETTLFATLPMILNVVFQTFVWGNLSDRLQLRRTLILRGELLAGIGTVLIWYVHTLTEDRALAGYVIIIGLSLIEIFWSMSNVNMQSLAIILWGIGVGWLGRRIGNGRTLCLGAGLGMVGLVTFAAAPDLGLIYLGSFFLGASHAVVYASSYAFAAALIPPPDSGQTIRHL